MEHLCYIDCNFFSDVEGCVALKAMAKYLHKQNTVIAMSLQWSYSKRPQYLRRGFLYGKDEP